MPTEPCLAPDATTRTAGSTPSFESARIFLSAAEVVTSPETGLRYRIERLLGEGGFGQVYLARRLDRSAAVPEQVCIKVSASIDGWLREAYFGQLLDGHPRAIRVFDRSRCPGRPGRRHAALRAGARVRAARRPQRVPAARRARLVRSGGPPRDRRHPAGPRQAASRPAAPSRPHAAERLRLRRTPAEARRLRHRAAAERSPRHHGADDERAHGAERHPRRRGAQVAGARRRLPGRPAAGDAGQGRRARAGAHQQTCARCPAATTSRRSSTAASASGASATRAPTSWWRRCGRRPRRSTAGVLRIAQGRAPGLHRHPDCRAASEPRAPPRAPARSSTADPRRRRPSSCAAGRTSLQAAGRDAGIKLMEIKRLREKGHRITLLSETQFWRLVGRSARREAWTPRETETGRQSARVRLTEAAGSRRPGLLAAEAAWSPVAERRVQCSIGMPNA